ncbi:MAG: hypothetical protein LBD20_09785, partial [Spirochaetaceae bacterium]|nr:hypothetical protein [Spirochaetaceae bacterium]
KFICFGVIFIGLHTGIHAADQIYFDVNYGVYFYPGVGGKIGWMHYWNNEKVGFICDVHYYNNGFTDEGDWRESVKIAHNFGLAAGVVFNNMGMNGVLRTAEYIKLKGVYSVWDKPEILPFIDAGFKLNVFFTEKIALSLGVGSEILLILPYGYLSLGMTFTL